MLHSHVVALLFFELYFHFVNSHHPFIANIIFFFTNTNNQYKPIHQLYLLTKKNTKRLEIDTLSDSVTFRFHSIHRYDVAFNIVRNNIFYSYFRSNFFI